MLKQKLLWIPFRKGRLWPDPGPGAVHSSPKARLQRNQGREPGRTQTLPPQRQRNPRSVGNRSGPGGPRMERNLAKTLKEG